MSIQFTAWIKHIFVFFILIQLAACATNFRQGLQNLENQAYPEALVFFEEDARLGYRIPAILAANLYIIDYQIPRNLEKSRTYLNMALQADYGRYDQAYDYYIPLIRAYQILADKQQADKSEAFNILNYHKYQEYAWPLYVLAHCHLVGHGTARNQDAAKMYFEKALVNQTSNHNNAFYAWWLSVYPDPSFRNPERALSLVLEIIDDDDVKDKPMYLDTLAVVYAANGQFEKAQETQNKAISILNDYIEKYAYMSVYKIAFESRLDHYKQRKPWVYSNDDIQRCGYDLKRCLKTELPSLPIESDTSREVFLFDQ